MNQKFHHKSIKEIEEEYELELPHIIETIKKEQAKLILLQFPEKMKPYAMRIANELELLTGAKFLIWLGNCWGACDIPQYDEKRIPIDLIIQFGHSNWNYKGTRAIFR
ncbi:diphthamide synthesis protein [Candidatus Pacearchaeota archaeon]|nr:diphthamide synthesis protein [Candidatus Pacearchaeota archaeon]